MHIKTEFSFQLPRGYIDSAGELHREGRMRLAMAMDEIESVQDPRVQASDAYLPVLLLSRVVTHLGGLSVITPQVVAGLFAIDLAYLEDLYQRLNSPEEVVMGTVCPYCSGHFQVTVAPLGPG